MAYVYVRNVWSREKRVSFITEAEYHKSKLAYAVLFISLFYLLFIFLFFLSDYNLYFFNYPLIIMNSTSTIWA